MQNHRTFVQVQDPPVNLMEVFALLDDDTLRRIFKMGTLTEGELREIAEANANTNAENGGAENTKSGILESQRSSCQSHRKEYMLDAI